jgi:hypothetical protein
VQRVWQAVAAWWAASAAAAKLAGIASNATANQTDAYLLSRANHTGTQAAGTITGLATVATSGAYSDLTGTPTIPAAYTLPDPYECGTFPLVTISAQPQAASVTAGGSATFSTTATATLPTSTISYQWQVSTDAGSTWSNVSGATSSSLTLSSLTTGSNGYRYRCQIAASLSLVYTSSVTLTVTSGNPFSAIPAGWTGSGTSASPVVPNAGWATAKTLTAGSSGTLRITGSVLVNGDDYGGRILVGGSVVQSFDPPGKNTTTIAVNISTAITAGQSVTFGAWTSAAYSNWGTNLNIWIA